MNNNTYHKTIIIIHLFTNQSYRQGSAKIQSSVHTKSTMDTAICQLKIHPLLTSYLLSKPQFVQDRNNYLLSSFTVRSDLTTPCREKIYKWKSILLRFQGKLNFPFNILYLHYEDYAYQLYKLGMQKNKTKYIYGSTYTDKHWQFSPKSHTYFIFLVKHC